MSQQNAISVQDLMHTRNEAQRAVELFLCDNYPIDSEVKERRLRTLARAAASAEHELRAFVHRKR